MSFKVVLTDSAASDLVSSAEYIAVDLGNPPAAESLVDAMQSAFDSLKELPSRGSVVRDFELARFDIRFVRVKNYYVFYQIDESNSLVNVLRILHQRRDWASILDTNN